MNLKVDVQASGMDASTFDGAKFFTKTSISNS
jgi:hypothetical protein